MWGQVIQYGGAGLLLIGWLWALARPVPGPDERTSTRSTAHLQRSAWNPGGGNVSGDRPITLPLPSTLSHRKAPVSERRRRRFLAFVIAAFVAFFLAIAFRGPFAWVFVLMLGGLVVQLGVASRVGAQEYRQRRAAKRAAAARRAAPAGVAIRADKASRQVGTDSDSAASGATGTDADDDDEGDDDGDPFLVAEAIASELGPAARGSGGRPNRQVSDLIDRAWSADGEGERTDR
ncbi:MAG: hypothetical protein ACK5RL_08770 [Acidimicrobiales bacterium]